jgi:hypothetical protein
VAYARISKVSARSGDNNNVTTAGIDTTGAKLIVVAAAYSAAITLTDSNGNTWTALTAQQSATHASRLYYCVNPVVGAGHTFTLSSTGGFPSLAVAAYSGAASSPFDQQNGSFANASTTAQPGSVTPTSRDQLLITGLSYNSAAAASVDSGFTLLESQGVTANAWGIGMAELIQTAPAAVNPTWTQGASEEIAVTIATFRVPRSGMLLVF